MEHEQRREYDGPEIATELQEVDLSAEERESLELLSQRFHVAITEKPTLRGEMSAVGTILGVTAGIIGGGMAYEQVGNHNRQVAQQEYTAAVQEAEYTAKVEKDLNLPASDFANVFNYRPEGFTDFVTDLSAQLGRAPTFGEAKAAFGLQSDGHIVQKDMLIALMKQAKLQGSQPIAMAKALLK